MKNLHWCDGEQFLCMPSREGLERLGKREE
jgi:hypothetical protein